MYRQSEKPVKQQYLLHISSQYGELYFGSVTAEIDWRVWGIQQISTAFASWQRYCTDVAERMSTKLCTIFGSLLRWYTIYTFSLALPPPIGILPGTKFTLRPNLAFSSFLLYGQRYCTAVEQWASATLCGVVQGMELRNFRSSSFSTEGATYIPMVAITLGDRPKL